ncbi:MAG: penicillin-binding protein 1C [Bacteroidota bacterium]
MKKGLKYGAAVIAALVVIFIGSLFVPLEELRFIKENIHSVKVFDRNGQLLREFLNDEQGRGEWVPLGKIAQTLIDATVSVEDRRFYSHLGVDPLAIIRAVGENAAYDGSRFGASTITQQVIRNVYHHPRTFGNKITEAWYALRLERMMGKDEILEQYLNRAPYGNQLFGIQAASKYYFDKPASDLTVAESAFLAGLPNAPTLLNPYQHYERAIARQRLILRKLIGLKKITPEQSERALLQPIPIVLPEKKFKAPHAVEMIYRQLDRQQGITTVRTSIDAAVQSDVQWIVKGHLEQLKNRNVTNAAVVIMHNATGEIRTLLGSSNYFDDAIQGKINGALSLRQPGSSVKIFTYGVAMEAGFTTASMIADIPTSIPNEGGDYVPENYDREYHGPVLLRTALACSYNIPAVRVLHSIGVDALYQRMKTAGLTSLTKAPKHYGYGLTLGNAEVTLIELTNAYRSVANGGMLLPAKLSQSAITVNGTLAQLDPLPIESVPQTKVFDPEIAYLLSDILSDHSARRPAFGKNFNFSFPCAVKTGTTKDYKDNWTLGFTTEYTVGVWVGNFDASPMRKVSGVSGAGQIFTDIMNILATKYGAEGKEFIRPSSLKPVTVCARSGMLKGEFCEKGRVEYFLPSSSPKISCTVHQKYFVRNASGVMTSSVFEIFPPEYDDWCSIEQIPKPPAGSTRINGPQHEQTKRSFSIIFPHTGDVFKVDPILRKEFQKIRVEAVVPERMNNVRLSVNGTEKRFDKDLTWWELEKGDHQFRLLGEMKGKRIVSAPVMIHVE